MSLTHDKKRRLAECFERGKHLAGVERNFDYAHAMFAECLVQEPGNPYYAETLISNLRSKFANNRKAARHLLRLPGEREFHKALKSENWSDVLRLGPDLLKTDPWHVLVLRGMANACQSLHYNEVELVYLKQALEAAPKDVDVNRHCARSLARMGQFDQAIACWHRVEEIHHGDREAAAMISRLASERMRYPGGKPPVAVKKVEQLKADSDTHEEKEPPAVMAPPELRLTPRQRQNVLSKPIRQTFPTT